MPRKRVDPLKAKEARQKKIAAVGGVILLALGAVQGPKTLKMLKGPQPVTTEASTPAPAPTTGVPATPATTTPGTPAPVAAPELTSVEDSDVAPEAEEGQLATFERFASKDPFVQQARLGATANPTDPDDDAPAVSDADAEGQDPTAPDADSAAGTDPGTAGAEPAAPGTTTGGFTAGAGSTPEAAPAIAEATSIAVNGVAEDVALEGAFPKDEPTFVLVSVAKNGKSVQIGIAGGEYANGGDTMTLVLGKKLTLQNTADGSRYELELRTIQGQPIPKKKK